MEIERTDKEILIKIPADTDITGVQRLLDFLKFREIASKSKASQQAIEKISDEAKKNWWNNNRDRFGK